MKRRPSTYYRPHRVRVVPSPPPDARRTVAPLPKLRTYQRRAPQPPALACPTPAPVTRWVHRSDVFKTVRIGDFASWSAATVQVYDRDSTAANTVRA